LFLRLTKQLINGATLSNNEPKNQLQKESSLMMTLSVLGIISVATGLGITFFGESFSSWVQWNIIGHSLVAGCATLPFFIYSYLHFRRTVGIRKAGVLFSGLLATLLFVGVFASGFHLVIVGHQESLRWISSSHTILAYVVVLITILHLLLHWFGRSKKEKKRGRAFITVSNTSFNKKVLTGIGLYLTLIGIISITYTTLYKTPVQVKPENYQTVYGEHPFKPSLTETNDRALVHINQIAKSEQCGACHTDIFEEWISSAHRQAASDPAYVKNINLLANSKGIAATRYCEGCHAPVALLTGELTEGGKHGGIKNTPAHLEGVGCMGCHGIESVISTQGTASYQFSPKEHYLFDSSDSRLGQKIRNFLIQSSPDKHKSAMSGDILKDPKLCASCHEQFMDKSMNDWGWVKMQSTYQEWLESPFSGQDDQVHGDANTMRCQDCHFPAVDSNDPSANKAGQVTSHRSLGANTMLPYLNGDDKHLELTKRFLQGSKLLVHIEKPVPTNSVTNEQFIDQSIRENKEDSLPYFLYLGSSSKLSVTVTNRLVGHSFPAGTTDLNQAWLYFTVTDGSGNEIFASGTLNEKSELDKEAHTYHSIPVDKQGKEVWRHDLFRMTGEVYKNVIPAGRSDIKSYEFSVPSWAKSPLTVEAVLKYRKFNKRYSTWALDSSEIEIPIVDIARDSLAIPLRKRQKAEAIEH
jgi:hypothetical protein